ncbi:hypothetical protein DPMN_025087 [Dreissena polymorpha]|uniref:Uncharacterized protein n=1 Tax=Dreissena polymorpha TaxID=45954 RepID=A0A9D4RBI2_DREPO|nr:hypothetical protein DPMN_025087 [Dreissena polymorpha]
MAQARWWSHDPVWHKQGGGLMTQSGTSKVVVSSNLVQAMWWSHDPVWHKQGGGLMTQSGTSKVVVS